MKEENQKNQQNAEVSQQNAEKSPEKPQATSEKTPEKPQTTSEKTPEKPQATSEKTPEKPQGIKLLPFNVKPQTHQRYKNTFDKTNDETLNTLLDCYENSEKIKSTLADANSKIEQLKNTISEKNQLLQSVEKKLSETISDKDLKTIKDRNGALEEQARQDKKLIEAYRDNKKNLEDTIEENKKVINNLQENVEKLKEQINNNSFSPYKGNDDFLTDLPQLTARLLELTAEKLTEARKDDLQVTPAMIVGDMFLKYTVQKRTMWFYRWVLTDSEILQVAQDINPNINSIRMLRRILKIDEELN